MSPADLKLPQLLSLAYRGNRLELLLNEAAEAQLVVNGLVRARACLGAGGVRLATSTQTGYEEHEYIEGRIRLHRPEGHLFELSAGGRLLGRLVAD